MQRRIPDRSVRAVQRKGGDFSPLLPDHCMGFFRIRNSERPVRSCFEIDCVPAAGLRLPLVAVLLRFREKMRQMRRQRRELEQEQEREGVRVPSKNETDRVRQEAARSTDKKKEDPITFEDFYNRTK